MVDWNSLGFNGMWLLGVAVIVAGLSISSYEASRRGERLRERLAAPGPQLWLSVGLALFSLGVALIGPRWWERALWGLLAAAWVVQAWLAARRADDTRERGNDT